MSFDGNRKDFENALEILESMLANSHHEISALMYDRIESVITEYNGHYKSDIDQLVDDRNDIDGKLLEATNEIEGLLLKSLAFENTLDELANPK